MQIRRAERLAGDIGGASLVQTVLAVSARGCPGKFTRRLGSNWRISRQSGSGRKRGIDGEETQDLSDLYRVLRSRPCCAIDEGGFASLGSKTNLFQQGFAKETNDPAIVAATLAKPGVVLRRAVGLDGACSEYAELPKELPSEKVRERTAKPRATTREPPARKVDDKAAREAALAFERERKRRDRERRKEEAAREKERKRREQAITKAESALAEAKRDHEARVAEIKRERAALDRRLQAEDARWAKQKETLEAALRRAPE